MLRITKAGFFRRTTVQIMSLTRKIKKQFTAFLTLFTLLCCINPATAQQTNHHKKTAHQHATKQAVKTHSTKKDHSHKKHLSKKHHRIRHAQLRDNSPEASMENLQPTETSSSVPRNHHLATVNLTNFTQSSFPSNFMNSVKKDIVGFVHRTVNTLHYSSYKFGGRHFDPQRGVYIVDCSSFVDNILQNVYPNAYSRLVNSVGADTPASKHYFDFFRDLAYESDKHWNKIDDVEKLQPGDILVFRYKNSRGAETGGHVMVVMEKPERVSDVYFVRIADSAPSRHSEDTRHVNESGIGIGTLLLKANPKTGQPSAFAWGVNSYWNKNVKFAMARPVEIRA